ncbi:MAG TPA: ABC transporter permease [Gemmatimonadaceae bacterium]|nr:ABC transporter permease [Gemmatimonadaceae bacterium]
MGSIVQDLRYAARTLVRQRGFTAVALLALALGIGANTAIYSVVHAVLFRPLPFESPGRLVEVRTLLVKQGERIRASGPDAADWRARNRSFTDVAAHTGTGFTLTGRGEPETFIGQLVSPQLFQILGVRALLGRTLLPGEDSLGRERVVVLSNALWRRRFGADPAVVGQPITLNGHSYTVVGVMPPRFVYPTERYQLWVPLSFQTPELRDWGGRGTHFLQVLARLRPGVTIEQAGSDMAAVTAGLRAQYPDNDNVGADVVSLEESLLGGVRRALLVLLGAVGFVLLVACANVANLLLARATARRREMAVRAALGASAGRIARQLLTESVLLAAAGGAVGLALATWGVQAMVALLPAGAVPRIDQVGVDGQVLAYSLVASLATGLLFGLAPALAGAGVDLGETLKSGGRGGAGVGRGATARLRRALVIAEVALSIVLLVGAGLAARSFVALAAVDPGFRAGGVMTMRTMLTEQRYPELARVRTFYGEALRRIEAQPWVEAAAVTTHLPMAGDNWENGIAIEGRQTRGSADGAVAGVRAISPHYFRAVGTALRAGRPPAETDVAGAPPVVVVNEELARRYWSGARPADVVGRRLKLADDPDEPWFTVVGVAADVKHEGLGAETRPELYVPYAQFPEWALRIAGRGMVFAVRSSADPATVERGVRQEVAALDPALPLSDVRPLATLVADSVAQPRFRTVLLAAFALLAVSLAAVGVYGVIAYAVAQRTRELGVRMALGAGRPQVVRLVVGEGLGLAAWGVAVGLAAALAATRTLRGLLYATSPTDPATFAAVSLLVLAVAVIAAYLPARRAARVDPMVALRSE